MEELNKEHNPGTVIENTTNSTVENNHVAQDPEPAFSDEEEESPLRLTIRCIMQYLSHILIFSICKDILRLKRFALFL